MPEEFNETNDLYLQMLRRAQEVEDPRLVSMILERLKSGSEHPATIDSACVVIPFPIHIARPESSEEKFPFWPRLASAQIGVIVMVYSLLIIGHSLFS